MRWVLALLVAALLGLWGLGLLTRETPKLPLQVIVLEELLSSNSPSSVLWEKSSGRIALVRVSSGDVWRSNPTSHEIVLVLRGRGQIALPQGSVALGPGELLIVFQGTVAEIIAQEDLELLVFSTPLPKAAQEDSQISGGLLPMRIVLSERFSQPLGRLKEGLEGAPVFESPTGSVWLLRLRGTWALKTEDPLEPAGGHLLLYPVQGSIRLYTGDQARVVLPGQLIVLPAGISAELERVGEETLLVGFGLSAAPSD